MKSENSGVPVFTETQWLARYWWWLGLLLGSLVGGLLVGLAPDGASTASRAARVLVALLASFSLGLFRLDVQIDEAGIHYRYLPVLNRWRHWAWADFQRIYLCTYSPLADAGGWGIRGLPGKLVYNVWGTNGLQLVFRSGDRLLLGTQRPAELAEVLHRLGKLSPPPAQ